MLILIIPTSPNTVRGLDGGQRGLLEQFLPLFSPNAPCMFFDSLKTFGVDKAFAAYLNRVSFNPKVGVSNVLF